MKSKIKRGGSVMNVEVLNYVIEKTKEMMGSASCSSETKAAAQAWLDAIGTEQEIAETQKYITELEADIMPIENLISFAESDTGSQVFGADHAKEVAAHGKEIKAAGAKYCDCPACAAAGEILAKKDSIFN